MTTREKSKYIYDKILKDGYIRSIEISEIFAHRNITATVTIIENNLGVLLYDDEIRVLRNGKREKSKSSDEIKYKYVKVFKSQTKLFEQWREEAKLNNGQPNGYIVTNQKGVVRVAV